MITNFTTSFFLTIEIKSADYLKDRRGTYVEQYICYVLLIICLFTDGKCFAQKLIQKIVRLKNQSLTATCACQTYSFLGRHLNCHNRVSSKNDGEVKDWTTSANGFQLGQVRPQIIKQITQGSVGSFLNISSFQIMSQFQRISMKQSRLKIPQLIGKFVIHGYRTVFPIPLAPASWFNPSLVKVSNILRVKHKLDLFQNYQTILQGNLSYSILSIRMQQRLKLFRVQFCCKIKIKQKFELLSE